MLILWSNDKQHVEGEAKAFEGKDMLSLVTRETGMSRSLFGKGMIKQFQDCIVKHGQQKTIASYRKFFDRSPELKSHKARMMI